MPTPESAIRLMQQMTKLCAKGGFNLTKFMNINREVLAAVPVTERADPSLDLYFDDPPVDRTLGVQWHTESDAFGFKVVNPQKADTMRGVVSTVCSVFDPLNLAAPVMPPAKQIIQEKERKGLGTNHLMERSFRDGSSGRTTFPS